MPALRTLAFAGGAIVLALTAVIFFLQTNEGSDRPDSRGTGEDDAVLARRSSSTPRLRLTRRLRPRMPERLPEEPQPARASSLHPLPPRMTRVCRPISRNPSTRRGRERIVPPKGAEERIRWI
jgi:hypothetical protein